MYERWTDLRMPRNQREAGIDHLRWEKRMKPLRPWVYDLVAFALLSLAVVSCFWLGTILAGAPK